MVYQIVGVQELDIPGDNGSRGYQGFKLFYIAPTNNRNIIGLEAGSFSVPKYMFETVGAPRAGMQMQFEFNSKGRVDSIQGFISPEKPGAIEFKTQLFDLVISTDY